MYTGLIGRRAGTDSASGTEECSKTTWLPPGLRTLTPCRGSNRFEPADPLIAGICPHPVERLVGTRHGIPIN